jgi:hypothetical protein
LEQDDRDIFDIWKEYQELKCEEKWRLIMDRKIIKIDDKNFKIKDMEMLENYIWQGEYLVPIEMLEKSK